MTHLLFLALRVTNPLLQFTLLVNYPIGWKNKAWEISFFFAKINITSVFFIWMTTIIQKIPNRTFPRLSCNENHIIQAQVQKSIIWLEENNTFWKRNPTAHQDPWNLVALIRSTTKDGPCRKQNNCHTFSSVAGLIQLH